VLTADISVAAADVAGLLCTAVTVWCTAVWWKFVFLYCTAVTVWCTAVWWKFVCVISLKIRKNFREGYPYSILL
jgi:hypothetical protein